MNGGCKNPTAMNGAFDRWFEGTDYQNGTFYDNESPGNTFHAAGYAGGYLTSVIGNKTIDWIKNITATNPSRPFFVYFAPHGRCLHVKTSGPPHPNTLLRVTSQHRTPLPHPPHGTQTHARMQPLQEIRRTIIGELVLF